jgi:NADPH:quinone reductase-like Zn-dependent oxidoreductase
MKAFVWAQYGPPSVLEFGDVDSPVVKDDEVLVCVHAASLNQGDLDYLYGKPFLTRMGIGLRAPRHRGLGFDAAGHVEAIGNNVTRFQLGDVGLPTFVGLVGAKRSPRRPRPFLRLRADEAATKQDPPDRRDGRYHRPAAAGRGLAR